MGAVEAEYEAPAIRALGSLFKLTEVHLWEDGSKETCEVRSFCDRSFKYPGDADARTSGHSEIMDISPQDEELIKEMDALGLPLSFQTNKEWKNKARRGKKKGNHLRSASSKKEAKNEPLVPLASKVESESFSSLSMPGQSESSYSDSKYLQCPDSKGDDKWSNRLNSCDNSAGLLVDDVYHSSSLVSFDGLSKGDKDVASELNLVDDDSSKSYLENSGFENGKEESDRLCEGYECLQRTSINDHDEVMVKCYLENDAKDSVVSKSAAYSQSLASLCCNHTDNHACSADFGDWMVLWDPFYSRNYFYNIKTQESTWQAPTVTEHLAYCEGAHDHNEMTPAVTEMDASPLLSESNEISGDCGCLQSETESTKTHAFIGKTTENLHDDLVAGIELAADVSICSAIVPSLHDHNEDLDELEGACRCQSGPENLEVVGSLNDIFEAISYGSMGLAEEIKNTDLDNFVAKDRKKTRKARIRRRLSKLNKGLQFKGILEENSENIGKYWCQRYLLFSRYDEGIKMDEEGWFSITPELIAKHHASRCKGGIIIDCFTGVGGNAIQFAMRSKYVVAIDVDPEKIYLARHNAAIYGVHDRIDFVKGDFFLLAPKLKADTVFLSPPWGGPDYTKANTYDIKTMLKPRDGAFLFNAAKNIASMIVMFLPRNIDLNQMAELSLSSYPPWSLEVERNYLNGKLKAVTAYFKRTDG